MIPLIGAISSLTGGQAAGSAISSLTSGGGIGGVANTLTGGLLGGVSKLLGGLFGAR